jgi:hypothetical protein
MEILVELSIYNKDLASARKFSVSLTSLLMHICHRSDVAAVFLRKFNCIQHNIQINIYIRETKNTERNSARMHARSFVQEVIGLPPYRTSHMEAMPWGRDRERGGELSWSRGHSRTTRQIRDAMDCHLHPCPVPAGRRLCALEIGAMLCTLRACVSLEVSFLSVAMLRPQRPCSLRFLCAEAHSPTIHVTKSWVGLLFG